MSDAPQRPEAAQEPFERQRTYAIERAVRQARDREVRELLEAALRRMEERE